MARNIRPNQVGGNLLTPLFQRFETARSADLDDLAQDIADILGARRTIPGRVPGVLGWGLPGVTGLSPQSDKNREDIAARIAATVERFETRLQNVRVTPVEDSLDFAFVLEAELVQTTGRAVVLRVLSPRRGGALGADIAVLRQ